MNPQRPLLALAATLAAGLTSSNTFATPQAERVVFIRGAPGTGGFLEGGADEQLSDIADFSTSGGNHGYGSLARILRVEGFEVEQVVERTSGSPVDFAALNLANVSVLVLGSNNQTYSAADVQAVTDFVFAGGGLLVISDANWGSNWGKAPSSDQPFLDPYGLVVNQDTSTYVSRASEGDHPVPIDPILSGPNLSINGNDDVLTFDGEGVSPLTVGATPPGVRVQILARAERNIRVNNSPGAGSTRSAGPNDASLVVAHYGCGAVVGHFDRNTFFNANGAGTNITRFDNAQLARNIFRFLSRPAAKPYGDAKINSQGGEARVVATQTGSRLNLSGYSALPGVTTVFALGSERASVPFFGGSLLVGGNLFRGRVGTTDSNGCWTESFTPMSNGVAFTVTAQQLYRDNADPTGFGISSAVEILYVP